MQARSWTAESGRKAPPERGTVASILNKALWGTALCVAFLATSAQAEDARADRTSLAQARLTATLVDRLQATAQDNVVVSPVGIAAAFTLLDLGTSESYRESARKVLGFAADRAAAVDFEDLRDAITGLGRSSDAGAAQFSFANAAVFDPKLRLADDVVSRMRETRAEVSIRPLSDHATVDAINGWVAEKTRGLIPTIVDDGLANARLVVLNALYFKDDWAVAFNKAQTRVAAFHGAGGASTEVPMMAGRMTMPFRSDGRFAAIDLRYKSDRFSLVLLTTRDQPATFPEFASAVGWLSGDGFEPADVSLQMPRFTLRQTLDVLPALDHAGLAEARHDPAAFAPMTPDPVDISAILQKIYLGINEQGTEAAAVTSVIVRTAAVAPHVKTDTLTFDRPFMFALRDHVTGLILLSGYLGRMPDTVTQ